MKTIIYNIGTLAGILPEDVRKLEGEQMGHVECLHNAYLVIEDGIIADFGQNLPEHLSEAHCGTSRSVTRVSEMFREHRSSDDTRPERSERSDIPLGGAGG